MTQSIKIPAQKLAEIIQSSNQIVVFTGAGMSTESGIADFRSPGGIWSRYKPVQYQEFLASEDARQRYWQYKKETFREFSSAQPNAGHRTIAEFERMGKLQALITQNIDGLHEEAGNSREKIFELHGTERWVKCLNCGDQITRAEAQKRLESGEAAPRCTECGGFLKPDTVSFGQSLPEAVIRQAYTESENCDAFLVIGSSLVVQPAASLPVLAKRNGAWLGILNKEPTPIDHLADWQCDQSAGNVLEMTMQYIRE